MHSVAETNSTAVQADGLSEAFGRWKKTVEAELKGAPFDKKLVTRTAEGISVQPLYTRADLAGLADAGSMPGQAPFLRGNRPHGYKAQPWQFAQEIAAATPQEFNAAVTADLMRGQDSVVLAPAAIGVATLADLRTALAKVELGAIPIHLVAGADPLALGALYLALAEERGVPPNTLTGSLAADPLTAWAVDGKLAAGLDPYLDSLAQWTQWSSRHAPALRTIGVNARIWGDAGANAVQELAFALAAGADYLRALHGRGLALETAAERFQFQFAVGPQFFTEIAKFRAWRALWTRVVVAFGADARVATKAAVHAATARWNKTLLDPNVNMLRVTTEALSAVLGGCDSLHIAPYDEVTGQTDDFSRRIARNIHTLLAEEFSFTQTADPAGGSWYVEKLTDELARKAWALFQMLESKGGYAACLRDGILQKLASEATSEKADAVNKRRLALVGTNLFPNLKEKPPTAKSQPATSAAAAPEKALVLPAGNWDERLKTALNAARSGATLMQLASAALKPGATPAPEIAPVKAWRASAGFERLRAAADAYAQRTGKRPRVFLAKMGPALQHKARADFSAGFFAPGGFEVLGKQAYETAEAAAQAAAESGAEIAVLCSTDETYPVLVPAFAAAAKAARGNLKLVLAGLPADQSVLAQFRAAGIDEFIHLRANVHDVLATFLKQIGALA